MGGDVAFAPVS